ncbi:hypothetical protein Barb4_00440 [Bacteroidales bacterium Barb4]|nr:hypothetical protein Barb4_00440 [Bacteroidales bacterium Barb4]
MRNISNNFDTFAAQFRRNVGFQPNVKRSDTLGLDEYVLIKF